PADIPRLLAVLDAGDDVVCGWRRARHDPWLTRRLPSALANRLIRWLTGVRMHDMGCTLRAYRRDILADVHLYGDMHRYLPVLVLRRLEPTPMVFLMILFVLTGVLSLFIGFLADIVIRGFYETQRKPAFYVRETDGMQGVE